jgi:hypothetical protein
MLRPGAHSFYSFCASIVGFITVIIDAVYLQNMENITKKVGISHSVNTGAGEFRVSVFYLF